MTDELSIAEDPLLALCGYVPASMQAPLAPCHLPAIVNVISRSTKTYAASRLQVQNLYGAMQGSWVLLLALAHSSICSLHLPLPREPFEHFPHPHTQVVGFDMVDDESKPERRPAKHMQGPRAWDLKHNPAYAYYAYYTYANLFTLNKLREARGLNTFALRPHAGALLLYQR